VLIFELFLKRFLNFRQASGNSSSKKFAGRTFFFCTEVFISLFLESFLFFSLVFYLENKNKNKKLLLSDTNNLDKQGA
jgi:hypothetical protein